jgi:NADPH-dependent 2,4-dienoyl-CoA reductase/sulfur reductase-like enzyme
VIDTGARPRRLDVPDGVVAHVLRTYDDGIALHQALSDAPRRVVVIGAGFIGAEVASSARALGHEVTVIEAQSIPLSNILGDELGARCAALHERSGVTLLAGTSVDEIAAAPGGGAVLTLGNGQHVHADVLVTGIGVIPNTEWLVDSGLVLNNGVDVDGTLFAHDRVVAVGDVARFAWTRLGMTSAERIEHWQVAADHGRFAAEALLAGRSNAAPISILPYFWSDQYGVKLQMLGRPAPSDHVHLVQHDDEGRLLALYEREGAVSAAFAISKPRALMQLRTALLEGVTIARATEIVSA